VPAQQTLQVRILGIALAQQRTVRDAQNVGLARTKPKLHSANLNCA
jgi:hypothetical protein